MYVYLKSPSQGLYTVGFYEPDGTWQPQSDHDKEQDAMAVVNYLNGGKGEPIQ